MKLTIRWMIAVSVGASLLHGLAWADDAGTTVNIKKWKADPVELMDKPDGKVVATKPAAALPMQAERTGQGWLKLRVGEKEYYVEASQARTDLKLEGKPKCENLGNATGAAASRGLGEQGCEP
jgi:hypothetical protein